MLLQNKSFLACNGLRYLAGAPAVSGVLSRNDLGGTINTKRNRYIGEATLYKGDATPSGYTPTGGAWYPNRITGGMGSRYLVRGSGSVSSAILAGGLNGAITITGSGTIVTLPYMRFADHFIVNTASLTSLGEISNTSTIKGVVEFKSTDNIVLSGQGTIPDVMLGILAWCISEVDGAGDLEGELKLPMALATELLGEGNITYAALVGLVYLLGNVSGEGAISPDLKFPANLASDLAGAGTIPDTLFKAIGWCVADILGQGSAQATFRGTAYMDADITSAGDLVTAESCAVAVWNALASAYTESGTMGSRLNDAGSASNPWAETLPGSYIQGQAGYIIGTFLDKAISAITDIGESGHELTSIPDATSTLEDKLTWLYEYFSGKRIVTKTLETMYKSDGNVLGTSIIQKDGTTITKNAMS